MPAEGSEIMIRIELNGKPKALGESISLEQLLIILSVPFQHVAIAVNDDVIPKSSLAETQIKNGDKVDILSPVAGG